MLFQAEDEKAWEKYASEFREYELRDWDDRLEDAVGVMLSVNDEISEFKDSVQQDQGLDPVLPVIPDSKEIPTQESHVVKKTENREKGEEGCIKKAPPFRIFVKNRGRSERIAKLQGKDFKLDEVGTGSTAEKAFDVE
uniref:Splicing factor n=1 Tax=Tanacetum cinerariifolium TaxID=118510 RepID=A0A699KFC5_TANCI|nr:splicing factor [Tanacetum cinerariifolium]